MGARLTFLKTHVQSLAEIDAIHWNSFSRVNIGQTVAGPPFMWGPSPEYDSPDDLDSIDQRTMEIDGGAGTTMYRFSGDRGELKFLQYDVTNLAYSIRDRGRAAVIGVGGGRDVLSAYYFGFDSITGIDINPIFIDNLTDKYAQFNRVASLEEVTLVTDEARSWFARSSESFDLIQMSLIDTWAATAAGAFALSENGLYTVEGWTYFLNHLTSDGVFTVSRWYAPENPGETGRVVSLAKATLFELGLLEPNRHVFLAGTPRLSTLIVSRSPLDETELTTLMDVCDRLGYTVLFAPQNRPSDPVLRAVYDAHHTADLFAISKNSLLDFSPPTDDRPFFFNQLRLSGLASWLTTSLNGNSTNAGVWGETLSQRQSW